MDQTFRIVISATDRATGVIKHVNDSFSRLTRPIAQMQSAVHAFSKEAGLDRIGHALVNVARASADVGRSLARIAVPLAAVAGVGSVAAVAELSRRWSDLGSEVKRTAATIGISTDALQSLRGAAQLAGLSAESLTGGLNTLGTTLEDAVAGRNQSALMLMNRLGISMHRLADGSPDVVRAFTDISRAIQQHADNPQVQKFIAGQFGLTDMLPLLRQGPAAIAALQKRYSESGAGMTDAQIGIANHFRQSLEDLKFAFEGVSNSIQEKLLPAVQPLIDQFSKWLETNRALIGVKVSEWIRDVGDVLKSVPWADVGSAVKSVGSAMAGVLKTSWGWKAALAGVALALSAPLLVPLAAATKAVWILGTALLTTPAGWFIGAVALIGGAAVLIYKNWGAIEKFFSDMWDGIIAKFQWALDKIQAAANWLASMGGGAVTPSQALGAKGAGGAARITGAPIGVAQNNPGNLESWGNAPVVGGFASFATPGQGLSAAVGNLEAYNAIGLNTVRGIVSRWAPPGENDTGAYVADVSRQTGFAPDQPLNLKDPAVVSPLIQAIIRHEQGQQPYSQAQIDQAIASRLGTGGGPAAAAGGPSNGQVDVRIHMGDLPPGARVTASASGSARVETRIDHSLSSMVTP